MRKQGLAPAVIVVLLLTACSKAPAAPSVGGGGGGTNSASVSIPLTDYGGNQTPQFQPVQVTIPVGGSVSWRNNDTTDHTVTSDTMVWNASVGAGGSFNRTFATAGTFTYACMIHSGMTGRVVVQ